MLRTYEGILKGNKIDWSGEAPNPTQPLRVHITVLDEKDNNPKQGPRMAAVLQTLSRTGAFSEIRDPSAWERKHLTDRPLPGREIYIKWRSVDVFTGHRVKDNSNFTLHNIYYTTNWGIYDSIAENIKM